MNPHDVLGLSPDEHDDDVIRKAYLNCLRAHPPDRDPEGFQRVRKAYDELRSGEARLHRKLFPRPSASSLAEWAEGLDPSLRRTDVRAFLKVALESVQERGT